MPWPAAPRDPTPSSAAEVAAAGSSRLPCSRWFCIGPIEQRTAAPSSNDAACVPGRGDEAEAASAAAALGEATRDLLLSERGHEAQP